MGKTVAESATCADAPSTHPSMEKTKHKGRSFMGILEGKSWFSTLQIKQNRAT
jgi:hypothetical protein